MAIVQVRGKSIDTDDVEAVRSLSAEEFREALAAAVAQDAEAGADARDEALFPSADPASGSAVILPPSE